MNERSSSRSYSSLKLLSGLLGVLALFLILLYGVSQYAVLQGLEEIEKSLIAKDMDRVVHLLEHHLAEFDAFLRDWAAWDDTYAFVENGNEAYRNSNLVEQTYIDNRLALLLILDSTHRLVGGGRYDLNQRTFHPLSKEIDYLLRPDSPLFHLPTPTSSVRGLSFLDGEILLMASRPIVRSAGEGPIHGVFIMARPLDIRMIERIAQTSGTQLQVFLLTNPHSLHESARSAWKILQQKKADTYVRLEGEKKISAWKALLNLEGRPVLLLSVENERTLLEEGKKAIIYFLLVVVGLGLVYTIAILSLIHHSQKALIHSRDEARQIMHLVPQAVVTVDSHQRITHWNRMAETITGYRAEEVVGQSISLLSPSSSPEGDFFEKALDHGPESPLLGIRDRIRRKDGQEILILKNVAALRDSDGKTVGGIAAFEDITEKLKTEEKMRTRDKLETLGQLASGVAHDLNNLLTPILVSADSLAKGRAKGEEIRELAEIIAKCGRRGAGLVEQLLSFSRRIPSRRILVDFHSLLRETIELLRHTLGKAIEIRVEFKAWMTHLVGDPSHLQNALINLALNARDAMPHGGCLVFSTRNLLPFQEERIAELADPSSPLGSLDPQKAYLEIGVTDTGAGIEASILPRIFEPFFTTKGEGGTGLGLTSVLNAIRTQEGAIRVKSSPGKGTTFFLYLPVAESEEVPEGSRSETSPAQPSISHSILLVDDETDLRELVKKTLESFGHRVTACATREEAMAAFSSSTESYDLLIVDRSLPDGNGLNLLEHLRTLDPALRAILSTGMLSDEDEKRFRALGKGELLHKPYDIQELAQVIGRVFQKRE